MTNLLESAANYIFHYWLEIFRELLPPSLLEQVKKSENEEEWVKDILSEFELIVEHLIRCLKIFRVASERFRLNAKHYEKVILAVCGLVRLRIEAIVFSM